MSKAIQTWSKNKRSLTIKYNDGFKKKYTFRGNSSDLSDWASYREFRADGKNIAYCKKNRKGEVILAETY